MKMYFQLDCFQSLQTKYISYVNLFLFQNTKKQPPCAHNEKGLFSLLECLYEGGIGS